MSKTSIRRNSYHRCRIVSALISSLTLGDREERQASNLPEYQSILSSTCEKLTTDLIDITEITEIESESTLSSNKT